MEHVKNFLKKEALLCIAAVLAVASMFFVPPSGEYLSYINYSVLALLFCLMAVVAGFKKAGLLSRLAAALTARARGGRALNAALVLLSFFLSMLVTNDVALLTLVPLTLGLFGERSERRLIWVVVMETVAANLGSLVTPIGNPQNLFLFSHYGLSMGQFFSVTLPLGGVCLALTLAVTLCIPAREPVSPDSGGAAAIRRADVVKYALLFVLCLLAVLKVLDYRVCLAVVLLALLLSDRGIFRQVDYSLLLTFVCFFIFSGNIARIGAVSALISGALAGRELMVSAAASQVISNVPAAMLLSGFTENARALLLGTNIGGLGTPVASLASLISLKLYCRRGTARKGRYLLIFSAVNFALLAALLLLELWL